MSMCDRCIHGEVCGLEDNHEEALIYCKNMIPIDVFDKIRAEIEQEYTKFRNKSDMWNERACGLGTALEIIDKYKAESEGV